MSPEQAEINAFGVDTRSDIYSLGVLLYELLTGTTPLERMRLREAAFGEIVRLIKEEEPPKPSVRLSTSGAIAKVAAARKTDPAKLSRLIRGELDWVVMKCLEKRRTRRYDSAGGLARDVERYLNDEPIEARPPSASYRFQKFATRHKVALMTVALVAAALVLGTVVSTWQALRATVAEAEAQQNERAAQDQRRAADQAKDEAVRQRDELRRLNYIADMNLAQHAWDANNLIRTRELLELHRPQPGQTDLRGFEWHYLRRFFHRELRTVQAHNGASLAVAFTPDGKRLITSGYREPDSEAREIRQWDAATLRRVPLELKGLTDELGNIALSRDGKLLAAGGRDKAARIWNLKTGELITLGELAKDYKGRSRVSFNADGTRLVSKFTLVQGDANPFFENSTVISIWDVSARKSIATIDKLPVAVGSPVFSPDGKYVAIGLFLQGVKVWDATTGREAFSYKYREGKFVSAVRFSLDGKRLVVGGKDGIHIFDVATREHVAVWPSASDSSCLAFSPDGHRLATGSTAGFVELWDFDSGQLLDTLRGHTGIVEGIAFSPEGTRLASVGADGSLRVWDTDPERVALSISDTSRHMELSADGRTVFSGVGDKTVRIWNTAAGELQAGPFEHQHIVLAIDLTPDNKRLIVADKGKNVTVWRVGKGTQMLSFKINWEVFPLAGYISQAGVSPDGKWYALPAEGGMIELWDLNTGSLSRKLKGFQDLVICQFSQDGSRLLGASAEGRIKLWDFSTGLETTSIQLSGMFIARIRFSPDDKLLAVMGNDRFGSSEARIVALESGREVKLKGHQIAVLDMAFSPDGKRAATASTDTRVGIWDLESGQEILMLKGHTDSVLSVRFSSDGHRLITASADGTVRIWDATPLPE